MSAIVIDGKAVAAGVRAEVAVDAAAFTHAHGRPPGLAVVLVGENPASAVYVRNKLRATAEAGMRSVEVRRGVEVSQRALLDIVEGLNADPDVDGILVQLPLPDHIDAGAVLQAIDPAKDVDGFHPVNAGRLAVGLPGLVPCTPLGCLLLIESALGDIAGLDAVVIGRSSIVGKPMAQLLLQRSATVTVAHSRTRDLAQVCARADILVAAVGRAELVRGGWVKPGACVIDVGINRDAGGRLVGDVAFAEVVERAGWITPVPGGVGPMTIACLLRNTLTAARARAQAQAQAQA